MDGKTLLKLIARALIDASGTRSQKVFDVGVETLKKMCDGVQWMVYQRVRKKSEAFFEKGSLYQTIKTEAKDQVMVFTKESIDKFINKANDNNFLYVSLDKSIRRLTQDDVFLLIDIKRYRFDYIILTVLIGEELRGIVLHSGDAMYPWEVFNKLT